MANEIDIIELGEVSYFTCATAVQINRGTLVKLTDPRTVAAHAAYLDDVVGVVVYDKDDAETSNTVSVMRNGIIDVVASGAITVGNLVVAAGTANMVSQAPTTLSGLDIHKVIGYALETATDAERIQVVLKR